MRRAIWIVPVVVLAVVLTAAVAWWAGADYPVVGRRNPPAELGGPEWRFVAFTDGDGRWDGVAGLDTSLRFEGRQVKGRTCNTFDGGAVVHGSSIQPGRIMSTAMGCQGSDIGRAELYVVNLLTTPGGEVAWRVEDGVLHLSRNGVSAELTAR
jgi:hypothetical protein